MKSLRKSLNGSSGRDSNIRAQISTPVPLPPVSKPHPAILPPQKVIRALSAYRPQAPQELPFQKGDFFYVLRDVENQGTWYEAHNPVTGARGLVPRSMFEEFSKNKIPSRTSQVGPAKSVPSSPVIPASPLPVPKTLVFYAIVLHDFVAERADELDAKAGDSITVVAQSNREWFVAKPIGRLGRPGLIPVSFVEIHDPSTGKPVPDVDALMDRGDLPKVEDWKRAMYNYKQNSIALGVIDAPSLTRDSTLSSPHASQNSRSSLESASPAPAPPQPNHSDSPEYPPETTEPLPEGILLSSNVVSFHYEMEEYWFRIHGIFQPYAPAGQRLPPAKQLILYRVYNDFYDFQMSLLETFPREAGSQPPHPRMLPYMPGPAPDVDDTLTATRRSELDTYITSLCDLSKSGAHYILESQVVRDFLALKPGDVGNEIDSREEEIEALFGGPQSVTGDSRAASELRDNLGRLKMQDEGHRSEGSDYEDEGYATSPQRRTHDRDRYPYTQAQGSDRRSNDSAIRSHSHTQSHRRNGSTSSFRATSPYGSHRSNSPHYSDRNAPMQRTNDDYYNSFSNPPHSSGRSSQAISSRSRSQSVSTTNLNSPPISAMNPQTAFVKIKIFDRVADDLIAIRVHPRVSHAELMDKVQARLGGEVGNLKYRDSLTNAFVGLDSDEDLRAWVETTDKHVLFAD
ncbi:hypothetical protein H0H81_005002 [Sphagnurus paluster]|uniref:Uncharacterized protein n=1 Tax=Sphagnurus paluster TaxID=117069 RepID=A0A9P7FUK0_9AGAR|nr:hypothetical protein H0H81_005002 [Sphagnurus paluster]